MGRYKFSGSFTAIDPADQRVRIRIYTQADGARPRAGAVELSEHHQAYITSDGQDVERLATGRYRILESGIELTSDDPLAP